MHGRAGLALVLVLCAYHAQGMQQEEQQQLSAQERPVQVQAHLRTGVGSQQDSLGASVGAMAQDNNAVLQAHQTDAAKLVHAAHMKTIELVTQREMPCRNYVPECPGDGVSLHYKPNAENVGICKCNFIPKGPKLSVRNPGLCEENFVCCSAMGGCAMCPTGDEDGCGCKPATATQTCPMTTALDAPVKLTAECRCGLVICGPTAKDSEGKLRGDACYNSVDGTMKCGPSASLATTLKGDFKASTAPTAEQDPKQKASEGQSLDSV